MVDRCTNCAGDVVETIESNVCVCCGLVQRAPVYKLQVANMEQTEQVVEVVDNIVHNYGFSENFSNMLSKFYKEYVSEKSKVYHKEEIVHALLYRETMKKKFMLNKKTEEIYNSLPKKRKLLELEEQMRKCSRN